MMFPAQVRRFVTVQWSRLLVLRWWPALVYPLALAAGSAALAARDAAGRLEWLSAASTNLQNLQAHPLRSLAESAVLIDADVVAWVALAAFGLTGLVVAAGPLRAAVVAVSAHVVGTLVSEGALGVRVAQGLEPASARSIVDVGPSFVVVGVLAATVVAGRGPVWRLLAAAAFGLALRGAHAVGRGGRRSRHGARGRGGQRSAPVRPAARAGRVRAGSDGGFDASTRAGLAGRDTPQEETLMPVALDQDPKFAQYAHPERLVSTGWLAEHLGDPGLVVVESDEDVLLYDTGHIPGAVKVDWYTELNDEVTRDYVDGPRFAELLGSKGIGRDTTVVIYGDKNNWWAAYALWVFRLFGHEDVRLLDGGRTKWIAEGRELTTEVPTPAPVEYPVVERNDPPIRAFKDDVLEHIAHAGRPLIDVRSPQEYTGERTHMPDYPQEGTLRGGHIPGAQNVPWARAAAEDATFKGREELEAIYSGEKGLKPGDDVIAYCRIGERSSHTWFVLTYLLGFENVRNYDGSWTEWGNTVRVPIVKGEEPGSVAQH
jgi:thiosulfate/3-mercaptopyruvate sulfurtransferase